MFPVANSLQRYQALEQAREREGTANKWHPMV